MKLISCLLLIGAITCGCQTNRMTEKIQRFPDGSISSLRSGYTNKSGIFIHHGAQTVWDQDGRIVSEGFCSDGYYEGEWKWWNGEEYFQSVYKDGKPWHGVFPTPAARIFDVDPGIRYEEGRQIARNR